MKSKTKKKVIAFGKFFILIGIIVLIPAYIYFFHKDLISSFSDFESVKIFFERNKTLMLFAYVVMQALQIIISIIPGQWLQIGAGYFYGITISYILSILGAIIGTSIAYMIAKKLGKDAITTIFGKEKMENVVKRLNSKKAMIIIFIIFVIPGAPKDLCTYAAGISEIKLKPFLILSILGRTPGMLGSIIIGRQIYTGSYMMAIIIGVGAVILFVIGIIYQKKVGNFLDNMYERYM